MSLGGFRSKMPRERKKPLPEEEQLEENVLEALSTIMGVISDYRCKQMGGIHTNTQYSNATNQFLRLVPQLNPEKQKRYKSQYENFESQAMQIDRKYPADLDVKPLGEGGSIPMTEYRNLSRSKPKGSTPVYRDPTIRNRRSKPTGS